MVTVAIPQEQKWAGEDWEIWLGVAAESSDLLAVRLYVRLLVSTKPAMESTSNAGLVAGIVVSIILIGCGALQRERFAIISLTKLEALR